jgi:ApaG protein
VYQSTTHGITVRVAVKYQADESVAHLNRYLFTYRITIENASNRTVQLMSRHWHIINGVGMAREVQGDGVIGKQPVLQHGFAFEYESYCLIGTPFGQMHGTYQLVYSDTKETVEIDIPAFKLEALTLQN